MTESSRPGASLVFTVRNEAATIDGFLATVAAQSQLPDEVVVTDGDSDDGTFEKLARFAEEFPRPVKLRRVAGNIARGRNAAIRLAAHDIIACTDAGCELPPGWFAAIVGPLASDPGLDVAAGGYTPRGRNLFERCAAAVTCPTRAIRPGRYLPSARSMAFRRRAWQRAGGFPEELDFAEDTVFDLAMRRAGCRFRYTPEAAVAWRPRGSLRAIARQFRNYARGDARAGIHNGSYLRLYGRWLAGAAALAAGLADWRLAALWPLAVVPYWLVWLRLRDWAGLADWRTAPVVLAQKLTVDIAAMVGWLEGRARGRAELRPGRNTA